MTASIKGNGKRVIAEAEALLKKGAKDAKKSILITPPQFKGASYRAVGTAPMVLNAFSKKAKEQMKANQMAGHQAKKSKKRDPKDFRALYEGAIHKSTAGWNGIPASAFRNALISACRLVGFPMTKAKMSIFVEADGFDREDGTPLIKITRGKPAYVEHSVRLDDGSIDIRPRPMWEPGWEAIVRLRWDNEQFSHEDVTSLMLRVGQQVGIGEGRPDSKNSAGMGWGLFKI